MSILVMCSNSACGELFEAPDGVAGRKVKCPACGTVQSITAESSDKPLAADHLDGRATPADRAEPSMPPSRDDREDLDHPFLELGPSDVPSGPRLETTPPAAELPKKEDEIDLSALADEPSAPGGGPEAIAALSMPAENTNHLLAEAQSELQDRTTFLTEDDLPKPSVLPEPGIEGLLEDKRVAAVILFVGLLGMVAGALVGATCFTGRPILTAFIGAGLGWVAGFILAFVLLMASYREQTENARCTVCGNVFPPEAKICMWCGSALPAPNYNPLGAGCLQAGSYAISNVKNIVGLTLLLVAGYLLLAGASHLLETSVDVLGPSQPLLLCLGAIVGFFIFAYWLQFLLTAIDETLAKQNKAPNPPRLWALKNLATGLKGLGALVVYVLPVLTLPLLPLRLLAMGAPRRSRRFGLVEAVRLASRSAKDFVILWLWLLLWSSIMVFTFVVMLLFRRLMGAIPPVAGDAGNILSTIFSALEVTIIGVGGCISGLALFRCIGLFGRQNATDIFPTMTGTDQLAPAGDGAEI